MRGRCLHHMPVTHFTLSTVSCRASRTTSMCSFSRCTRCSTWCCTSPSTSGPYRSTMAASKCQLCCGRSWMAQRTIPTITSTTHATMASTSRCGIDSVDHFATRAASRDVDRLTRSWRWNQSSQRRKPDSCSRSIDVRFLKLCCYLLSCIYLWTNLSQSNCWTSCYFYHVRTEESCIFYGLLYWAQSVENVSVQPWEWMRMTRIFNILSLPPFSPFVDDTAAWEI